MKPTVGRIVHYFPDAKEAAAFGDGQPTAAIVTYVNQDGTVGLMLFPFGTGAATPKYAVARVERPAANEEVQRVGRWDWPEIVAATERVQLVASEEKPAAPQAAEGL